MTPEQIINDVRTHYAEYLEMFENPDSILPSILAHRIILMQFDIDYLKKRLEFYDSHTANT